MELAACPSCGAFSDSSAATCSECGVPFPEDETPAPPLATIPTAPLVETPPLPAVAPEAPLAPPPFAAAPEVLARIDDLEGQIAKKPQAPALYLQLSKVYAEAQRMDLATAVVERFLAIDPGNAYMRHKLAQLTGTPEAVKAPTAAPPSVAAPPARAASPSGTVSFQAGLAQRPAAPTMPRRAPSLWSRYKIPVIAGVAVLGLAASVKLWFFPSTRLVVTGSFRAHTPVWAPHSRQFAFLIDGDKGTQLGVYDMGEKRFRSLGPAAAWDARSFAWSPDGTRIAYTAQAEGDEWGEAVKVVDVASGRSSVVAPGNSPAWTADGQSLVLVCSPERPAVYDEDSYASSDWTPRFCTVPATGGAANRGAAAEGGGVVSPLLQKALYERYAEEADVAVQPDNRLPGGATAAGADDFTEAVIAGGARNLAEASRDLSREASARQHMERRKAVRGAEKLPYAAQILVGDIGGGEPVVLGGGGRQAFPAWTPDGERIQFATDGAQGIEIWTMNAQGGDRKLALGHGLKTVDPTSVTLSHDGKYVFFVATVPGDPGVAKTMTGESPADLFEARVGAKEATRLTNTHPFKQRFAVSPDGKYILYEVLQDLKLVEGAQRSELWLMRR